MVRYAIKPPVNHLIYVVSVGTQHVSDAHNCIRGHTARVSG